MKIETTMLCLWDCNINKTAYDGFCYTLQHTIKHLEATLHELFQRTGKLCLLDA
jgi:hypothetical protein